MSNVSQYDVAAANNNAAPPDGAPEGHLPSKVNDIQRELMAALARWYQDTNGSLVSGGAAGAYTLTTNNAHAALADQSIIVFRANHENTGAATLNVDTLGAKGLKSPTGADLVAGAIKINQIVVAVYNATDDVYQLPGLDVGGGPISLADTFALTGDITPGTITGDQNNYNPAGLSTASTLRLSSDAARNITGLAGGADGRILKAHNVGTNNITLKDESASSAAANRFALNGDITIKADTGLTLQYDSTSSRWRALTLTNGSFWDFESAEQTVAFNTVTSVAHGFGALPSLVQVVLRNKVAEDGYSPGDELPQATYVQGAGSAQGVSVAYNATNVIVAVDDDIVYKRGDTGQAAQLDNVNNWRWVFRAKK